MTTKSGSSISLRATALAAALALPACSLFKGDPDVQAVVNQRLLGTTVSEFIDRFGRVEARTEMPDGSTEFNWQSGTGFVRPGPAGQEDPVCKLHIAADGRGHIGSVVIVFDPSGRTSTSRCREIFGAS